MPLHHGLGRRAFPTLALWLIFASGLTADPSIRFQRFGYEEGLAADVVRAVVQDHIGYVWVGTSSGLQRFDGYRFETFRISSGSEDELPSNDISALWEDPWGRLWIGTSEGLALFQRDTKRFLRLPLPISGDGQPAINCLLSDRDQTLWIGTPKGIFHLPLSARPPRSGDLRSGFDRPLSPEGISGLPDLRVNALAEDPTGALWIGTRAGLLRLSSARPERRLDRFVHGEDPRSLHDDEIYALLVDDQGELWIGAWGGGGLGRLPADQLGSSTPEFSRFEYPLDDPRGLGTDVVKSLFQDRKGNIWIGTQHASARLLSAGERRRAEPRFRVLSHDPLDPTSLPGGSIISLSGDALGGVWIGSILGGLGRHVPITAAVTSVYPLQAHSPRSIWVRSVRQLRDGTVWAATSKGLDRIRPSEEGSSSVIDTFRHDPENPDGLTSDNVQTVYVDREEQLWVGTARGGLHRLRDEAARTFDYFGAETGLRSRTVFAVLQDSQGVLWVGTYSGLFRSTAPGAETFERFSLSVGDAPGQEVVYDLKEDPSGRLWVIADGRLYSIDPDRVEAHSFAGTADMRLEQVVQGHDGLLWLAGDHHGLVRLDPKTGEVLSLRKHGSFPEDECQSIAIDNAGRVWATSQRRMYRYDPKTDSTRSFGKKDGFSIQSFLPRATHRGLGGELFVGGSQGLIRFRPDELNPPPLVSRVELRQLYLANQAAAVSPEGPLTRAIESLETLELQPKHRVFSIEFAALSFHRQSLVRYAHRLKGFSDDWTETDADNRLATFTNLSPGRYTFEVKAKSEVGSWSPQATTLDIVVLPSWYQTLGFRLAAGLLFVGLPLLWIWIRFRQLSVHRHQLQELVDRWQIERQERERLQDFSVEASRMMERTRDPLMRIHRRAEGLSQQASLPGETRRELRHIVDHATQTISQVGQFFSLLRGEQLQLQTVDLSATVARVLELFDLADDSREPIQGLREIRITADEQLLTQMLFHLIADRHRLGGSPIFTFVAKGTGGSLRIEDHAPLEMPKETTESDTVETDLRAAERLAKQQGFILGMQQSRSGAVILAIGPMQRAPQSASG